MVKWPKHQDSFPGPKPGVINITPEVAGDDATQPDVHSFEYWARVVEGLMGQDDPLEADSMPEELFVSELGLALLSFSDRIAANGINHDGAAVMLGSILVRGWELGQRGHDGGTGE
jgi:hypothetical protein